ncbi:uracil-DNA glycosylase [bacterium]|nr:uracil-DNA glycosylase [bacterium]
MDKNKRMDRLKIDALTLKKEFCDLSTNLVWGEGSLDSALMIVGEAPGIDEDRIGRPFVGKVGCFLDRELDMAGIERRCVYITNTAKCWSFRMKGTRRINRTPSAREIEVWSGVLLREVEIVGPALILCLGSVSAGVLIHRPFAMTENEGIWFGGPFGSRVMATFHPGYVARFGGMNDGEVIKKFRRDLLIVAAELMKHNI